MSGSITDSDAGAQDWDTTWTPSGRHGFAYEEHKFVWKVPWQKVMIKVWFPNGKKQEQISACPMPVKIQFLVNHHVQRLYTAIRNIEEIQVKTVGASNELIEITITSSEVDDVISVIENKLTNEFDDIVLKTIQQYKFTPSLAEEQFRKAIEVKNIDLTRNDKKIFIVGFSKMKTFIDQEISEIDRRSLKIIEQLNEKWKIKAVQEFRITEKLSKKFSDVTICEQDNFGRITFHGKDGRVREAIKELNNLMEDLSVERLHVDPLLIKLLTCKQAAYLFSDLLKRKELPVVWAIEDQKVCLFSKSRIEIDAIRFSLYENFVVVGFSKEDSVTQPFCKSKIFSDCVEEHSGTVLIREDAPHGVNIAATKDIVQNLLCQEKAFNAVPENGKYVQVNTMEHLTEDLKAKNKQLEKQLTEANSKLKEENASKQAAKRETAGLKGQLSYTKESLERQRRENNSTVRRMEMQIGNMKLHIQQLEDALQRESNAKEDSKRNMNETDAKLKTIKEKYQRMVDVSNQINEIDSKELQETSRVKCLESNVLRKKTSFGLGRFEHPEKYVDKAETTRTPYAERFTNKLCTEEENPILFPFRNSKRTPSRHEVANLWTPYSSCLRTQSASCIQKQGFVESKVSASGDKNIHDQHVFDQDVFVTVSGEINPGVHLQKALVQIVCEEENVMCDKRTMEVEGTVRQLMSLNKKLIDKCNDQGNTDVISLFGDYSSTQPKAWRQKCNS